MPAEVVADASAAEAAGGRPPWLGLLPLVAALVLALVACVSPRPAGTPTPSPTPSVVQVSSQICGVNLKPVTATGLQVVSSLGATTVRLATDQATLEQLSLIKAAGLRPLVILRGCSVSDPTQRLADNKSIVKLVESVFGSGYQAWFELGNESDLECGLTSAEYVQMWKQSVPELKALAPNAWFGGPVNYQANPAYIANFVHSASPKPSFVSWHSYTCPSSASDAVCYQGILNWNTQISQTRQAIQANGDAVPPIIISEWNYAPDGGVTIDNKHDNAAFMRQWTQLALLTLMANGVYSSDQFDVYGVMPLADNPQGIAYSKVCQGYAGKQVSLADLRPPALLALATPQPGPQAGPTPNLSPVGSGVTAVVAASDTFSRPDSTYWGTASDGQVWGGQANTSPAFAIRSDTGVISGQGATYDALLGPVVADGEVLVEGSLSYYQNSNLGAVVRWGDTNNWYKAYVDGQNLVVQRRIGGVATILKQTPFPAKPGVEYAIRFRAIGSTLAAKVWKVGDPEPSGWMVVTSDSQLQFGREGIRTQLPSGVTATIHSFQAFDLAQGKAK